jgi:hypothetical protein
MTNRFKQQLDAHGFAVIPRASFVIAFLVLFEETG